MSTDDHPHRTTLSPEETGGLGTLTVEHPAGTFPPSPATRATVLAIAAAGPKLEGTGFDWGCGVGILAVAAARVSGVRRVIGLDLSPANVEAARVNAVQNEVAARTGFFVADSFHPVSDEGRREVEGLAGRGDFLIANPPASATGDGFDLRRRLLAEGRAFLRFGAIVLLQALSAYGSRRVESLTRQPGGYAYEGIVHRTPLVPVTHGPGQINEHLATYVRAERSGARAYEFAADRSARRMLSALEAQEHVHGGGDLFGRWQVHRFRRTG
jgi:hypothetical protein